MSDFERQGSVVVWGITVPQKANGRHMWPDGLKAKAASRVMAGTTVAATARDISANKSLVARWLLDYKVSNGTGAEAPTFVQIVPAPEYRPRVQPVVAGGICNIHLGDGRLSVSPV